MAGCCDDVQDLLTSVNDPDEHIQIVYVGRPDVMLVSVMCLSLRESGQQKHATCTLGEIRMRMCATCHQEMFATWGGRGPYRIGKEEDFSKKTEVAIDLWGEENKLKFERLLNILEFFFSGQYGGLEEHHDWQHLKGSFMHRLSCIVQNWEDHYQAACRWKASTPLLDQASQHALLGKEIMHQKKNLHMSRTIDFP